MIPKPPHLLRMEKMMRVLMSFMDVMCCVSNPIRLAKIVEVIKTLVGRLSYFVKKSPIIDKWNFFENWKFNIELFGN